MSPTKRYELLCEAAATDAQRYLELRERKTQVAAAVAGAIAEYFGMPNGSAKVVALDENLRAREQKKPIGSVLDLRIGSDGLSYFGLSLHFETSTSRYFGDVTIVIGVDVLETSYVVKHLKSHTISDFDRAFLEPFLIEVFETLMADYGNPARRNKPRIGFIDA